MYNYITTVNILFLLLSILEIIVLYNDVNEFTISEHGPSVPLGLTGGTGFSSTAFPGFLSVTVPVIMIDNVVLVEYGLRGNHK